MFVVTPLRMRMRDGFPLVVKLLRRSVKSPPLACDIRNARAVKPPPLLTMGIWARNLSFTPSLSSVATRMKSAAAENMLINVRECEISYEQSFTTIFFLVSTFAGLVALVTELEYGFAVPPCSGYILLAIPSLETLRSDLSSRHGLR